MTRLVLGLLADDEPEHRRAELLSGAKSARPNNAPNWSSPLRLPAPRARRHTQRVSGGSAAAAQSTNPINPRFSPVNWWRMESARAPRVARNMGSVRGEDK